MTDALLPDYKRELSFIRKMGAEFAEEHPEVAEALRLGPDTCEDPHVERLILAFAYMAARIRHKLDDDFPELTNALLGVLYPHYQAPVPSMAVIQFQLDRSQAGLTQGFRIEGGKEVETDPLDGEPCRFQTVYPVTLWPIEVADASLSVLPSTLGAPEGSTAAIRIVLGCFSKEVTFSKLAMSGLRFFLSGQAQHVFGLYELIFKDVLQVTLANSGKNPHPIPLGKGSIAPVGFDVSEGILPYSARSFPGYRLLTEYFTFPQKFCFFDVKGIDPGVLASLGKEVELCLYLGRTSGDLEKNVTKETFRLGCTPMVNLFHHRAEPVQLTHTESEYHVVPDARRPLAMEIYSIDRVTAASPGGEEVEFHPFYSFKHGAGREKERAFWYSDRRPGGKTRKEGDHGTEVYLSLVDLEFSPTAPSDWILAVETTCLNRDLPGRLPFGGGQPVLHLTEGGPLSRIACLTPPTPTLRPQSRTGAMWRLISHLSLNHLSIAGKEGSPEGLQEILKLYDFTDSAETRSKISGLLKAESRRVSCRLRPEDGGEFCHGLEVHIHVDEEKFSDSSLYLFSSVLERFLSLYASINSFSRLLVSIQGKKGIFGRWPPRAGERILL